jgi:hypothetical protein
MDFNPEVKERLLAWYNQFKELSTEPMSEATSRVFINWSIAEKEDTPVPGDITTLFGYQVLDKRAEYLGLKLTPSLKIFLTYLTGGVPGTIVMYLSALKCYTMQRASHDGTCDMMALAFVCSMGFPSEKDLSILWDAQKMRTQGSDNMLDVAFV